MELRLVEWTNVYVKRNGVLPTHPQTKQKAIDFAKSNGGFKASKGWYEKFMNRHFGGMKTQPKIKTPKDELQETDPKPSSRDSIGDFSAR